VTAAVDKSEPNSRAALAAYGRRSITQGSKSFALASLLFGETMQADAHMLYAWCRHCDDVIDGQSYGEDAPDAQVTALERQVRLERLRSLTLKSLRGEQTGEPAFDAFADVARQHQLPTRYPMDLLDGFALDADGFQYDTLDDTLRYCYGVAGVVGIMMAIIMGVHKDDEATLDRACDLGLAFQLTNICRDLIDDAKAGRVYAPADMLAGQNVRPAPEGVLDPGARLGLWRVALALLDIADVYYASASQGVRRLPPRAAAAVAAARNIYREIGAKIRRGGPDVWRERVALSSPLKATLAISGAFTGGASSIFRRTAPLRERGALWSRRVIRPAGDCS
jgi:phytoene synthase